jgi:hypothetical protein
MSRHFHNIHNVETGYGAHPALYPVGNGGPFPGAREVGHSSPPSADVMKGGAIPPIPVHFHGTETTFTFTLLDRWRPVVLENVIVPHMS